MSPLSVMRRRRVTAVAAALFTAGAMSLTLAQTTTASAAAPKVTGVHVTASKAKVRTSTGKYVTISVYASKPVQGSSPNLSIAATTPTESHSWYFPIAKTHFTLGSTGKGKIAPAAIKVSPFAKVNLTVKPAAAAKTQRCNGQAISKTQKVRVTGTFWLDTKSGKKWGKVGSKTKRFTFGTTSIATWTYANSAGYCDGNYLPPCANSVSWGSSTANRGLYGEGRKVFASRSVKINRPKGATRYDSRTVTARSAQFTKDDTAGTATLKIVGNGSSLTGTAKLVGTNRNQGEPTPCKKAGKKVRTTYYFTSSFTNGPKPLKANDIFGSIGVPNTTRSAYLSQTSVVG